MVRPGALFQVALRPEVWGALPGAASAPLTITRLSPLKAANRILTRSTAPTAKPAPSMEPRAPRFSPRPRCQAGPVRAASVSHRAERWGDTWTVP